MTAQAAAAPTAKVEAAARPEALAALVPDPGLRLFRKPDQQLAALIDIAADPRGCVVAAVVGDRLVGYVALHPPTEVESWGKDRTGELIELGAIEVAREHRGMNLARRLLTATFAGGRYDATVVFATLYAWHYDLKDTGLTDLAYRRKLERLYRGAGMQTYATSDEEVRSNAANALMARVGPAAPAAVVAEFHRLRLAPPEAPAHPW